MKQLALLLACALAPSVADAGPRTTVSIEGEQFFVNGEPTYKGRTWKGHRIEGLLFNARMVQGIFDDLNPRTRERFVYPDTGAWDPDRNTDEFVAAMPSWVEHGMLGFTLNLQGGSPMGYGNKDWVNRVLILPGSTPVVVGFPGAACRSSGGGRSERSIAHTAGWYSMRSASMAPERTSRNGSPARTPTVP